MHARGSDSAMIIRRIPEDFRVDEIISASFSAGLSPARDKFREHSVWRVDKKSLTTQEAVVRLAKAMGVRAGSVAYAGLKDKHAVTRQWMTARFPHGDAPDRFDLSGVSASLAGWSPREVRASDIDGNSFEIVIRRINRSDVGELEHRASRFESSPGRLVFINYFGDQRFGSARHGQGFIARHLIRAEFEEALRLAIATPARKDTGARRVFTRLLAGAWGDWAGVLPRLPRCPQRACIEALAAGKDFRSAFASLPNFEQRIIVDAYQSHLWNRTAALLGTEVCEVNGTNPVLTDTSGLVYPPAAALSGLSYELPLFSPATRMCSPWCFAAERVLREEGISLHDLRIPGLRRPEFGEAPRPLLATAGEFALNDPSRDELSVGGLFKRTVRCVLPRGAYATVLFRAIGQDGE